jgi:hypothetical protein
MISPIGMVINEKAPMHVDASGLVNDPGTSKQRGGGLYIFTRWDYMTAMVFDPL